MKLIDPKMSIDTIKSYIEVWDCKGCLPYGGTQHNVMAVDDLPCLPTIEAEPVRHGRWETWGYVFHGIEWKRCSCCGICADVSYYGLLDGEIKMSTPAICGCCGARMDADHIADVSKKVGGADNGD